MIRSTLCRPWNGHLSLDCKFNLRLLQSRSTNSSLDQSQNHRDHQYKAILLPLSPHAREGSRTRPWKSISRDSCLMSDNWHPFSFCKTLSKPCIFSSSRTLLGAWERRGRGRGVIFLPGVHWLNVDRRQQILFVSPLNGSHGDIICCFSFLTHIIVHFLILTNKLP